MNFSELTDAVKRYFSGLYGKIASFFSASYLRKNVGAVFLYVIAGFILYSIATNFWHAISIKGEMSRLQSEKQRYLHQIAADSTLIEQLKSEEGLEKYARERHHMQRKNEDVFRLR